MKKEEKELKKKLKELKETYQEKMQDAKTSEEKSNVLDEYTVLKKKILTNYNTSIDEKELNSEKKEKNVSRRTFLIATGGIVTGLVLATAASCAKNKLFSNEDKISDNNNEIIIENDEIILDDKTVEAMSAKFLTSLANNKMNVIIDIEQGMPRNLTGEDIKRLIYWCNYNYLTEEQKELACSMEEAALMIAIISDTYDQHGQTSQRIAGISGLPEDINAGNYTLDMGGLFIEGTLQQQEVSKMSNLINTMKNNPTKEGALHAATSMLEIGINEFLEEKGEMFNGYDGYLQANFVRTMMFATSQNAQNLHKSITIDDNSYNSYSIIVENINEKDGLINAIGREIEKIMNNDLTRKLGIEI